LFVSLAGIAKWRHGKYPIPQASPVHILADIQVISEMEAVLNGKIPSGSDDVIQEREIERASLYRDAGPNQNALQNAQLYRRTVNPGPGHVY
jgi:hypothetical protein